MTGSEFTPPKKSGNIWKWIGCGCGGALLLGLGLLGALIYTVQKSLNISFDPQKAESTTRGIIDYNIPGGSRGFMTMNIKGIEFAAVASNNLQDAMLVVGRLPKDMANSDDVQKSMVDNFQKNQSSSRQFQEKSHHQEAKELCGQKVKVNIIEGETNSSRGNLPTFIYEAAVNHQDKLLFIYLQTSGKTSQSDADNIFNSLKCK